MKTSDCGPLSALDPQTCWSLGPSTAAEAMESRYEAPPQNQTNSKAMAPSAQAPNSYDHFDAAEEIGPAAGEQHSASAAEHAHQTPSGGVRPVAFRQGRRPGRLVPSKRLSGPGI